MTRTDVKTGREPASFERADRLVRSGGPDPAEGGVHLGREVLGLAGDVAGSGHDLLRGRAGGRAGLADPRDVDCHVLSRLCDPLGIAGDLSRDRTLLVANVGDKPDDLTDLLPRTVPYSGVRPLGLRDCGVGDPGELRNLAADLGNGSGQLLGRCSSILSPSRPNNCTKCLADTSMKLWLSIASAGGPEPGWPAGWSNPLGACPSNSW